MRGRQSAAIVVAPPEGEPWRLSVDLRVEDHPEPLDEIERLLDLADAYRLASEADDLVGQGRHAEASALYVRAAELAPGNHELVFWSGLSAAEGGDMDTAVERVRAAIAMQPGWAELLGRLEPEIAPSAAAVRAALARAGLTARARRCGASAVGKPPSNLDIPTVVGPTSVVASTTSLPPWDAWQGGPTTSAAGAPASATRPHPSPPGCGR